ncbi:MAG: polysaccharide biosynthesis C-terminal domain-containing protein [Bacteroidetes bacterium]|nr:polysaccharide biosynthesis C-terminal domain-containing protein [Bacteroidota bacterium]
MKPLQKLAGQTVVYGMGTIVPRLLNYLLLTPFYTRIFLEGEYGIITELYAYVAFLLVLLTYGMETSFFRFAESEGNKSKVFTTTLTSLFFTSVVFVVLATVFSKNIASLINYDSHPEYIVFFVIIVGTDAFTAIPFAQLRQQNRAFRFAWIKIINVSVNIFFNFFFFLLCPYLLEQNPSSFISSIYDPEIGIGYAFISNLIASLVTLVLLFPDIFKISFSFDSKLLKRMLAYGFPLLLVGLFGMVNEVSDKILFRFLISVPEGIQDKDNYIMSQLGIYGANYRLAVLMTLFIQMFRYAAEPFFFSHSREENARLLYASVMKYFIVFCLLIFLSVTLFLDIFKYFIGSDFRSGLSIVPIILLANLLLGIFYNLSVWYKLTDKTRYGALIAFIGAFITIVLNVILIPRYGYTGAAWAHLACYFSMVIISFFLGRKYYRVNYDLRNILLYFILALFIYFISVRFPIPEGLMQYVMHIFYLMVFLLFAVFLEKRKYREEFR